MDRRALLNRLLACGMPGAVPGGAWGWSTAKDARVPAAHLPKLGPAPAFVLTDQDGRRLAMDDLRGKVLAVTFIYTACSDACPLLTARLAALQAPIGAAFGPRLRFISISVLPEHDTPAILRDHARAYRADLRGWSFLTGPVDTVQATIRAYGSYAQRNGDGKVDHLTLTSLVDKSGQLRVQYLGTRFRDDEMLRDLHALLAE